MPKQDQLEIIGPSGQIEFHDLDPARGVTNIGRDPENDVVIDSPGVALFQAVLDHQQKPYRIMLLSEEGEVILRRAHDPASEGQRLAVNAFEELHDWDSIELDGHTLVLLEGAEAAVPVAPPMAVPLPTPVPGAAIPPPPPGEVAVAAPPPGEAIPAVGPPTDRTDELIVTEISEREWTVDVEQTVTCELLIANGGNIVATFNVAVEGLDESWVIITPPSVNLYEGGQATVNIHFTPPRLPSSSAGRHPLAVVVTSPNYPGHLSRRGAILTINPYYEFTVGELSPKQQSLGRFKRVGQVTLPISNKGNNETPFRLDAEDDERGLRFEFEVPGEEVALVKQAEMRLAPDTSYLVPIQISPIRRPFIALRSRQYSFTITTSMVEGAPTPRSVMGRAKVGPIIGPILLLLIFLGFAALTIFFVRPYPEPALLADTNMPKHEEPVTLEYDARRFPALSPTHILNHQNAFFLRLSLEFKAGDGAWQILKSPSELTKPLGAVADVPLENGRYRVLAQNWISGLLPMFTGVSRELPVYVTPVEPDIAEFRADKNPAWSGEEITIFWKVAGADTLILAYDGIEESFQDDELESGQRKFTPEADTTYTLIASNRSWPEQIRKPLPVTVLYPTPTPVPTPVVVRFDVDPLEIMVGEAIRIDWEVQGADEVDIEPLDQGLPVKGNIGDQPTTLTTYQLIAYKIAEDGSRVQSRPLLREVIVNPEPSATPEPVAPEIQVFEVTPKEVIIGDDESVKLTWSVGGQTTDIEITAPNMSVAGLQAQDVMTVTIKETTLFVLTAYNGALSRSAAVEVVALEPTPTPTATPVPTEPPPPTPLPPTATPFPPPVIAYFKAGGQQGYENKVSFQNSYDSENGPVYVYSVEAGSFMQLSWEVNGADVVAVEGFGPQPAKGELPIPDPVTSGTSYILTAENHEGQNKVMAFIQVQLVSPPPPPPPYNVTGQEDFAAGTNTINWSYGGQDRLDIDGFRIYRADVPPGTNFAPVWTAAPDESTWEDKLKPGETCGKAYYLVAVYTDLVTGKEKETAASTTSWYSEPCSR